jgi:hypothetical protein
MPGTRKKHKKKSIIPQIQKITKGTEKNEKKIKPKPKSKKSKKLKSYVNNDKEDEDKGEDVKMKVEEYVPNFIDEQDESQDSVGSSVSIMSDASQSSRSTIQLREKQRTPLLDSQQSELDFVANQVLGTCWIFAGMNAVAATILSYMDKELEDFVWMA